MRRLGVPIALWLASAAVLASITGRVADWFVMTDELLYERLALSIDRLHSPIPHVHQVAIGSINQLYPLLLAPFFASGTVAHGLHGAHLLNALVITFAAVPAYLLALRVTRSMWASALAAVLTVAIPWIVLSSFLLTENAAYPVFALALLAFHIALTEPSPRHDAYAAAALVLAIVARTQFVVLAVVLAILAAQRWREHRVLVGVFAAGVVLALVVVALGHSPLGTYSAASSGNPIQLSIVPSFFTHLARIALGLGLLPFVVGGAWLLRREPFAELALATIVVLTVEVASYDERFGGGIVHDRYLFYIAPLFAIAFAAALAHSERPRWTLAVPAAVLVVGLSVAPLPVFQKLTVDSPTADLNGYLRSELGGLTGARIFLVVVAVVAVGLVVEVSVLLGRRAAVVFAVLAVMLTTAETGYAFERLFRVDGTTGRPMTVDPSGELAWLDRTVGRGGDVTIVPYPVVSGEYWPNAAYWWDLEFWNVSASRQAGIAGEFEWTPSTFAKLAPRFGRLGRSSVSPPGYVAQAVGDVRFHIAGTVVTNDRGLFLVKPDEPWRADWTSTGLYDDGWTKPGTTAHIRVYAYPGQNRRVLRTVTVYAFAPAGVASRPMTVGSSSTTAGSNEVSVDATVCVPPNGSAEVPVTVDGQTQIYGDPRSDVTFAHSRMGGVQISRIYLSGAIGADC